MNEITLEITIPEWLHKLIRDCKDSRNLTVDEVVFEALCGYLGDLKNGVN